MLMNGATEAIEMKKYKIFEIFAPWPLFGLYDLFGLSLDIGWPGPAPPPQFFCKLSQEGNLTLPKSRNLLQST